MANVLDKTLDEVMSDVIKKLEPTMRRLKPKVKKEPIAYVSPKVDPPVAPSPPDFSQLLQPSLKGLAQGALQAQEQAAAQAFNGAFSTTSAFSGGLTGGLGGFSASSVGGIPQHSHTLQPGYAHQTYTQGIAVISASYGDSMIPTDPSRESLADPEVDAAINNVIAKLRNKKEEVRYARGVDTDIYEWKGY